MTAATPDTSVVIAGLSSWHPDHELALPFVRQAKRAVGHVIFEAYAVLTRLPGGQRVAPVTAWKAVDSLFDEPPMMLDASAIGPLLERLSNAVISGGATFDALVAETARFHDQVLVSLDRRAAPTYDAVGVRHEFLDRLNS